MVRKLGGIRGFVVEGCRDCSRRVDLESGISGSLQEDRFIDENRRFHNLEESQAKWRCYANNLTTSELPTIRELNPCWVFIQSRFKADSYEMGSRNVCRPYWAWSCAKLWRTSSDI